MSKKAKKVNKKEISTMVMNGNCSVYLGASEKRLPEFEDICLLTQAELKARLEDELVDVYHREIVNGKGFLYAPGTFPVLLCAHLDTVHKSAPKEIYYENGCMFSPQGIGGDDRCGVYMVMELIKYYDCSVVFFEDEEIGGVGSTEFVKQNMGREIENNMYVIQLDRMNANDAVFYDCFNPEFMSFITTESEFYEEEFGSFTDICHICPDANIAGVNLSCGYYNQHTKKEFVCIAEMEEGIKQVRKILARTPEEKFVFDTYDYTEDYGHYRHTNYGYKSYDDSYTETYYEFVFEWQGEIISDAFQGDTMEVAFFQFMNEYSFVCMNDILEINKIN